MRFTKAYTDKRKEILFSIFDRFPDLSNHGTAAILFRDHPEYFKDTEDARRLVRLYRGKTGKWDREHIAIKKYYR